MLAVNFKKQFNCTQFVQTSGEKKEQGVGNEWQTIRKIKAVSRKINHRDKTRIQPRVTDIRRVRVSPVTAVHRAVRKVHQAAEEAAPAATQDNSKQAVPAVMAERAAAAAVRAVLRRAAGKQTIDF